MRRRRFLWKTAAVGALGASSRVGGEEALGPQDLRPPEPIGLAAPSEAVVREAVARCQVRDPSAIKILQLTDLHFFCNREKVGEAADQRTREDIGRMVERHQPDVVAFTGDVWHDPEPGRSAEIFGYALEAMESVGRPWFFLWGNHDLLEEVGPAQVALTRAKESLYRGAYTGGNYRVLLETAAGAPLADLVCLNTTTQGVQAAQETWLRDQKPQEGLALCFLHIPLAQYVEAWGTGKARGMKHEEVCTYGEDGSAFPWLQRLGVRACFCGHDHVNDYGGEVEGGVEMVYGRATGHAGYGSEKVPKGGKLITLNAVRAEISWESVFADGTVWRPEG